MKKSIFRNLRLPDFFFVLGCFLLLSTGCQKTTDAIGAKTNASDVQTAYGYSLGDFTRIVLNANKMGYNAVHINPRLHNAWGMSESPGGTFWVSAADAGLSFVYDRTGKIVLPAVSIPSHLAGSPGNPTGQIFNGTTDFVIPGTSSTAKFIFASEDGTLSGWAGGPSSTLVADRNENGAGYTGLTMATDGGANYLYAANFKKKQD